MKDKKISIKLSYITGLKSVVLSELAAKQDFNIVAEEDDSILSLCVNKSIF